MTATKGQGRNVGTYRFDMWAQPLGTPIPLVLTPFSCPLSLSLRQTSRHHHHHLSVSTQLQSNHLIQQCHRLLRTSNPSRRAGQPSLKVIASTTQKLISHMQRRVGRHPTKPLLTPLHPQTLIANIDKDIVPAIESAERDPRLADLGRRFHRLLHDQHRLLELLAGEAKRRLGRVDADGAFFAEDGSRQVQGLDAGSEGGFGDVEEGLDGGFGPGVHEWEDPVAAVDVAQVVGGGIRRRRRGSWIRRP